MILPSKHLSQDRALLTVGTHVLQRLCRPKTVSALWEEFKNTSQSTLSINYDGFVLALDLLFIVGAIEIEEGLLSRKNL